MFMFRKKDTTVSTATGLQKEAKKFQNAVKEINQKFEINAITIDVLESYAKKADIEVSFLVDTFETYLKKNALSAVRKVKASSDYTVLDLEQAVSAYGFEMDDLDITFFSEE